MTKSSWMVLAVLVSGCALETRAPSTGSDAVAAGLSCERLPEGGSSHPFAVPEQGVSVHPLQASDVPGYDADEDDLMPHAGVGVRYLVPATPSSSSAWLERKLHCYRATNTAPRVDDPLLMPDTRVVVRKSTGAYVVDVTSSDPDTARELQALAGL